MISWRYPQLDNSMIADVHDGDKLCTRCRISKSRDDFGPDRRKADGLKSRCRGCEAEVSRDWRKRNPAKMRAQGRRKYARQRVARPAHQRRRVSAWRRANRERSREITRRGLARRRLGRDQLACEYADVLRADPCSYCGEHPTGVDHIDATARGGTNGWENLTAACGSCNPSKGAMPLLLWLAGCSR